MVRRFLVSILLAALLVPAARPAGAADSVATWIEALTIEPGPAAGTPAAPAVLGERAATAVVLFEPGAAMLTAVARENLDVFAAALTAPPLQDFVFEIQWYADPKALQPPGHSLLERRAAAMYFHVQAKPGITPARVMLRAHRRKPAELGQPLPPDSLFIRVVNRGLE